MKYIIKILKLFSNGHVIIFFIMMIISSIVSAILQSDPLYNINIYMKIFDNILRVLSGAATGGLLTVLVLNHTTRMRAIHSYRAIIWRIVELSLAAYVDILGNYGRGDFVNRLMDSGFRLSDGSSCIQDVIFLLKEKASEFERAEKKNEDTTLIYGYYKYDRTKGYLRDLTDIYAVSHKLI